MYQALYRKYRPLTFSDVAGQSQVADTLRSQVAAGRVSHAYLFTGTRGTGKTSCAKILARAVNCQSPVGGNPCNVCPACLAGLEGSLTDVSEIDAASNNGVDNIRSLRDETAYTPVSSKFRVYIIDEVHMLTPGAFNALLKILEEPPSYVLFILATTETHKVPATILSRCQRFAFKRLSESDIAERIKYVAEREHFSITDGGAKLLARLSDGAMRDGLSLLDQCAADAQKLDEENIKNILGVAGDDRVKAWLAAIIDRDAQAAFDIFNEQVGAGIDYTALLGELSQHARNKLAADLNAPDRGRLLEIITAVQNSLSKMARAPRPRIEAELCLFTLTMGQAAPTVQPAQPTQTAPPPAEKPKAVEKPIEKPATEKPVIKQTGDVWVDVVAAAKPKLSGSARIFLGDVETRPQIADGVWTLELSDAMEYTRLSDKAVAPVISAAIKEVTGKDAQFIVVRKKAEEIPPSGKLQSAFDRFKS